MLAADDFGKNLITNQRILTLVKLRAIQRVAVLVDGKISPKEIYALKQSGIALDIHLNLSTLTGKEQSKQRAFGRLFIFLYNYLFGKYSNKKIQTRWLEQIEKFENIFGTFPDGLNSHEHVHFFPSYFKLFIKLAQKYKIPRIRFAKRGLLEKNNLIAKILALLWKINYKNFKKANLNSSQFLVSFDWLKNPKNFIANNKTNDVEIVCHPERSAEFEIIRKI